MAASGWMTTNNQYIQYWIEAIQNSQSTPNNTSNVTVRVWVQRMNTGYTTYGTGTVYCNIDGGAYSAAITTAQKITNTPIVIFEKTLNITHNVDGKKRLDLSASISHSVFSSNTQYWSTDLTTIPRASQPSGDDPDGWYWYGQTIKISTNRAATTFTHTLRYSWGTQNGTIATGVTDSYSWVIPKSFISLIPNDSWSWGTIFCDTYSGGTFIGTKSFIVYTAVLASDATPTFTSVTAADTETLVTNLAVGSYVQSMSKPKFTINGAAGIYGSTIKKYEFTFEGATYTGNGATAAAIKGSGTIKVTATITDSRGFTASQTLDLTVLAYSPPVVTTLAIARASDSSGTLNELGTWAKITRAVNWNSLNSKNTLSIVTKSRVRGTANWTTNNTTNAGATGSYSTPLVISTFTATQSYDFQIEFTDKFNTTLVLAVLSTGIVTMSWGPEGISVGKVWERGTLDVKGDFFLNDINLSQGNLIPTGDGDSLAYWRGLRMGTYMVTPNLLTGQPSPYGILVLSKGNNDYEFTAIWYTQFQGTVYRKSGNASTVTGWIPISNSMENPIIWTGGHMMMGTQYIYPSKTLTSCLNGWILVWSYFNGTAANDSNFTYNVVTKNHPNGMGVYSLMGDNSYNPMFKYVYVFNDQIRGHDSNNTGTKGQAVLRNVIAF